MFNHNPPISFTLSHQFVYYLFQFPTKLFIIAAHTMTHLSNNIIVIFNHITKCAYVLNWDNGSHSLCDISCKFHLVVIHMFIKPMLTGYNDRCLTDLQRHDKTCWASVSDNNTCILNILYHLLIRNELTPLTILRFISTEACLHNYIFLNYTISF